MILHVVESVKAWLSYCSLSIFTMSAIMDFAGSGFRPFHGLWKTIFYLHTKYFDIFSGSPIL